MEKRCRFESELGKFENSISESFDTSPSEPTMEANDGNSSASSFKRDERSSLKARDELAVEYEPMIVLLKSLDEQLERFRPSLERHHEDAAKMTGLACLYQEQTKDIVLDMKEVGNREHLKSSGKPSGSD